MRESVVLLHGFGGTRRAWDGVLELLDRERYLPLALDLPGHGEQASLAPVTFAACVEHVLARAPQRFTLCGYSLGGRVALHAALAAPARVSRLVLVSTSAGICDAAERRARRAADAQLARELRRAPFERFIERWQEQSLFAQDPPAVRALAAEDQLRNQPGALADALDGIGAGRMQPLWGRLAELSMPASVLAGARDARYLQIAQRMASSLPCAQLVRVRGGHRLALENPAAVARAIEGRAGTGA